tara:strand:- start:8183 stop:8935 length:753 start_codon:yes stop_codon:yes gene_type:complete
MEIFAVDGIPEIQPGDNIPHHVEKNIELIEGDVILIASTIVSKSEGRAANLSDFSPSPRANSIASSLESLTGKPKDPRFAQAVLDESSEILLDKPFLLCKTHFGHICVNAGIDRSNTGSHDLLLLPINPSNSALELKKQFSPNVSVIITDTCGRPFRYGQVGVAIGWAGISAHRDWRGTYDLQGYELEVTLECIVDELASAANLLMGEGNGGTPVVVIRGWEFGPFPENIDLFRKPEDDVIRKTLRRWNS